MPLQHERDTFPMLDINPDECTSFSAKRNKRNDFALEEKQQICARAVTMETLLMRKTSRTLHQVAAAGSSSLLSSKEEGCRRVKGHLIVDEVN